MSAHRPDAAAPARRLRASYRIKVPLALSAVALLAGIAVSVATYSLLDRHVESNAVAQAQRLAATLARSLTQSALRNDVWQAYQLLKASAGTGEPADVAPVIVVIDAGGRVFASLQPRLHPVGLGASQLPTALERAAAWILADETGPEPYLLEDREAGIRVVAERMVGEERSIVGGVILQEPLGITTAQRRDVISQLGILGALAVASVAALGWVAGLQLVGPLERLSGAMRQAPERNVREDVAVVSRLNDEVGDLGGAFLAMMDELEAKRDLERDMLQAERLASIGRLTAGIAHEVNNPLGGMLAAIGNRRLRGQVDEATERTLSLLERGLGQIHSTVGALLHEARTEIHELAEEDLHDLHVLLKPEADQADCRLDWQVEFPAQARLPSVPVRQVVLNLVLNAISAAGPGGAVSVRCRALPEAWQVRVANTGRRLDAAQLERLVSGNARAESGRLGLGLWVTARVLHGIGGRLALEPPPADGGMATTLLAEFPARPA